MSTIDLIILGSLYQSPKSAYELQKQIEDRHLARWVKIGSYTVYKKVIQYEKKGFVFSETKKNGNMPERTVYTLTPNGKTKFHELMSGFSAGETRIFLDFNAVIVNMPLLNDADFNECINNIKNSIYKTKNQIQEQLSKQKEMTIFGQMILEQQYMLLETLEKWEMIFEQKINREDEQHD
ncbi:MAG: PadR family transcriptional regulator [Lachnospiraceae bacterium]|nr:PadR family transcriptional regulator [Lachnospiraceae bacterium]